VKIERILRLEDGAVKVAAGADSIRAQWLIDASGAATVVGRHLGARRVVPGLEMVAHFGHFTGARRNTGRREGDPTIVMCREGWFWFIPLNAKVTSVGLVMDREAARQSGVAASRRLFWGIERCPVLAERMAGADGPEENEVVADFSYRCRPYAGPGHFLVGDAATFIDPIFSTGVALAMKAGLLAAEGVGHLLEGASPRRVRRRYVKTIESATGELFRMVRAFYDHSFRELLLSAKAPLRMRDAAVSVFSGEVFPRSPARIRWRLALFRLCVRIQRRVALAPRQETWSLLRNRPEPSTRDLRRQRP
jgi:flavin-dependent dehydrogenase